MVDQNCDDIFPSLGIESSSETGFQTGIFLTQTGSQGHQTV